MCKNFATFLELKLQSEGRKVCKFHFLLYCITLSSLYPSLEVVNVGVLLSIKSANRGQIFSMKTFAGFTEDEMLRR